MSFKRECTTVQAALALYHVKISAGWHHVAVICSQDESLYSDQASIHTFKANAILTSALALISMNNISFIVTTEWTWFVFLLLKGVVQRSIHCSFLL